MYEKLIFPFKKESYENTPAAINPFPYFKGESQIEGSEFTVLYNIFTEPVMIERNPRFHDKDLYICFLAGNLPYMFDWDAEIEMKIGNYGVDEEKYTITQPTIIRIPAGVWYGPINLKVVNKPVLVQTIYYDKEYTANYYELSKMHKMRFKEPGKWELIPD